MGDDAEAYYYKWILLGCSSAVNFIIWGIFYSVGIYYVKWVEFSGASNGEVAIVGSLPPGTGSFLAPLFGLCIHRYGFRAVGMTGGILVAGGLMLSTFTNHLLYLGFFYGVLGGIGAGFCHLASAVGLNYYFNKRHRSLAEGITSMGVGCGTFTFNVFSQFLLNSYGWRGALLITGAIAAHLVVIFQMMVSPSYLQRFSLPRQWRSGTTKHGDVSDEDDVAVDKSFRAKRGENDENAAKHESDGNNDRTRDNGNNRSEQLLDITEGEAENSAENSTQTWLGQTMLVCKRPVFILLLTSDFLCWICIMIPYVHLPERCRLLGMDSYTAAWISSTMGITGILGRPVICGLPHLININVVDLFALVNILLGAVSIISPFFSSQMGLFIYAGVYGFLSVSVPLARASAAFLLGQKHFPIGYSWMLLFEGIGIYLGPPIAGWIFDLTLSYDNSFYFMGTGLVVSGLLLLAFWKAARRAGGWRTLRKSSTAKMPDIETKM